MLTLLPETNSILNVFGYKDILLVRISACMHLHVHSPFDRTTFPPYYYNMQNYSTQNICKYFKRLPLELVVLNQASDILVWKHILPDDFSG